MNEYLAIVKPIERQKEVKKMRVETPFGNLESDSGNHILDVGSIIIIICVVFVMKKFYEAT